ncbi:hypothetical protein MP638_004505 [Amoeboaphelidium occidentale]|nr:hypothetical protein MP638_004505 [Amoeboaphelidium occidentale]
MKKSGGRKSKGATISKQNSPKEDNGGVGDEQRQETSEDVLERNLANVGNIQDGGTQEAKADEEADAELDEDISPEYEMFMRGKTEESMQQMKRLLEVMNEDQLRRYETYRSAAFPKMAMKRILQQILNQNVPERMAVMIAGVAKLYVGELVEEAREILNEAGKKENTPIRPEQLREASFRLQENSGRSAFL